MKNKSKLTPHQLSLKQQRIQKLKESKSLDEAAMIALDTLFVILPYVLYFYCGWKNKRIVRLLKWMKTILNSVTSGERTVVQLADELEHECQVRYDFKNIDDDGIRRSKVYDLKNNEL